MTEQTGYRWLTPAGQDFLDQDYLVDGETLEGRVTAIAAAAERILGRPGFAAKFKEYVRLGYFSLATPVWSNFGNDRGLPISCFGSHISDSMTSILDTHAEVGMMSKYGGGTSGIFKLRGRGEAIRGNGTSSGSVHFMQLFDRLITVVSQGSTRRGQFAAYLDIDHPDVMEFLDIRRPGNPLQDISTGVCVTDEFMNGMIAGEVAKRKVWAKVLESRSMTGYPYIVFTDTANRVAPDCYRDAGLRITHSNLCTEIFLPDSDEESFVCDLSSMNVLYFDEWKGTDAVETLTYFLDAVMTEFITKAERIPHMAKAVRFARRHRALGIGQLGWHSYLQSRLIPFESMEAKRLNVEVARTIRDQAYAASRKLAAEFGEPEVLQAPKRPWWKFWAKKAVGYGRRNTTLIAIAPTKSSAFILGQVSEGIEPHRSNYYIKDLQKGKYTIKNTHLQALLASKGMDTHEVWDVVLKDQGSVRKLDCLTDREKEVFKTFAEISPMETVILAAQRQKYIDQGQSLNLHIPSSVPVKDLNALVIEAWRLGVKSLYYQINVNAAQEFTRSVLSCSSCEA